MESSELVAAVHGGNLAVVARRHGIAARDLLDLSANLNPLGPPHSLRRALHRGVRDRAALTRYPDDAHGGLVAAIARRHGIDPATIVVANGAAALIDAAVRVRTLGRCLVPVPAFSEDRRALAAAATRVVPLYLRSGDGFALDPSVLLEAMRREACDACLLTNPNNPSGSVTARAAMVRIVSELRERAALTIVDEAFVDYVPGASIVDVAARHPETIVIRSLTKFYAVPSLRVGFAVCVPELAQRLRAMLPPWPVTSFVATALAAALEDLGFEKRSLRANARERRHLARRLTRLGFRVIPGAANFLLLEVPSDFVSASSLVEHLIVRDGIVVRDCSSYEGLARDRYLRVAVRDRHASDRLCAALARAQDSGHVPLH